MAIFLVSAATVASAFYIYVLIKFVQDETRLPHQPRSGSKSALEFRDCASH
jgi:hypothetical protein